MEATVTYALRQLKSPPVGEDKQCLKKTIKGWVGGCCYVVNY